MMEMNLAHAVFLGIVQGATEWLPISSSGHLVIAQQLFGLEVPVAFNIMLHVGSLVAVVALLWKDMLKILRGVLSFKFTSRESWFGLYLIVAMIVTTAIGFMFKDFFESLFSSLLAVGCALVINGSILFSVRHKETEKKLKMMDALWIGTAQGFSLIPGLSRSGLTISTGLWRGIDRQTVVLFSFLLGFLAITGASILEIGLSGVMWKTVPLESIVVGTLVSAAVSYFALITVVKTLMSKRFHKFAYYCWVAGAIVVMLSLL